ncbi:MAG: sugar phosphate isomerase/epimerase family protein [Nitrospirota bacterium]
MINPHVHIPYERIEEHLHFIRENRLNLEIFFSSYLLDTLNDSHIHRLKERLDYDPSLTIHAPYMDLSPGAVDSKVRAITVERFSQVFDIAGILRPKVIVFHSGYEKWKYAYRVDIWLEGSLKTWLPFVQSAREIDVKIAIENVFEDEPGNLRMLMGEINSGRFGICFDTGHFNLFSREPLDEWLRQLKPYIMELHLHDNNRTFDDHFAIGDGSFDFKTLFLSLKEKNIVYTIEVHSAEGVAKSMQRLKEYWQSQ